MPQQLSEARVPRVDLALSTAATSQNLAWIARVLRPFGHVSFVDGVAQLDTGMLMSKSISAHTEMVFSRILHDRRPQAQGDILDLVATMAGDGRIRSIAKTRLQSLSIATMKAAHELLESHRSIGKVVITI